MDYIVQTGIENKIDLARVTLPALLSNFPFHEVNL